MIRIKGKNYPGRSNSFKVFQDYAWRYYMGFFMALMLIMFYQLARRGAILEPGIIGVFATVLLSNLFAMIHMQKDLAEIVFHEGHFYLGNVYQVIFNKKPDFFPLPYANAKLKGDYLEITYFDSIYTLHKDDWENWDDLLYYFGFRWYH